MATRTKHGSATPKRSAKHAPKKTAGDSELGEEKASSPRRSMWSGSLGFGLLQIPVNLYPLERAHELSFHQLDGRDMSPIGYKRYNKATGDEVPYGEIVRGYEIQKGEFVVVSDDELKAANVEATQSIDILDFVDAHEIPPAYFETPYLVAPAKRGEKAYAVLRDALAEKGRAAIATVVLRTRQHLACVLVEDRSLVLEILRFAHELRKPDASEVSTHAEPTVSAKEREMAAALIDQMTSEWDPAKYKDSYRDDVLAMIERKAKTGEAVTPSVAEEPKKSADVTDIAALLQRSLKKSATATKRAS